MLKLILFSMAVLFNVTSHLLLRLDTTWRANPPPLSCVAR